MNPTLIKCPYCQFDIPSAATVCGHCTKDIAIFKPFISYKNEIDDELRKLKIELSELRVWVQSNPSSVHLSIDRNAANVDQNHLDAPVSKLTGRQSLFTFAMAVFLCAGVLDLLHWLLLFVYDTNLLVLRIITILIPALVGFFVFQKIRLHNLLSVTGALGLGILSVMGMLAITSYIDRVPFAPESVREWREVAEYVFAIACSFVTGLLIENWRESHQINIREKIRLELLIEKDDTGKFKAPEWTLKVESLFAAAAPFISAATAVISGVRVFMG